MKQHDNALVTTFRSQKHWMAGHLGRLTKEPERHAAVTSVGGNDNRRNGKSNALGVSASILHGSLAGDGNENAHGRFIRDRAKCARSKTQLKLVPMMIVDKIVFLSILAFLLVLPSHGFATLLRVQYLSLHTRQKRSV